MFALVERRIAILITNSFFIESGANEKEVIRSVSYAESVQVNLIATRGLKSCIDEFKTH